MELTLKDIIGWILDNKDNEEAMTQIAVLAYPYSGKFKKKYPDREPFHRDDEDFPIDVKI